MQTRSKRKKVNITSPGPPNTSPQPIRPRQSRRKARETTPPKRAQTYSTVPTSAKQRLHGLDHGRCLITFEKKPTSSQQVAHIVTHKTSTTVLKKIQAMWKTSDLNLDSRNNLVTLRADWHLSYVHGDWAFVPAENILRKILNYKTSSFTKPYPGFELLGLHDYVFVPLPILRRHYICRQASELDEGEDEGEKEDRESGGWRAESGDEQEDEQHMMDTYIKPFFGFPTLKHHSHPFFVIYNALPKLQKHEHLLRPSQRLLLTLMTKIEQIWTLRIPKTGSSSKLGKRRSPSDETPDDRDDNRPKRKTKRVGNSEFPDAGRTKVRIRRRADVGKGKAKAGGPGKTKLARPQESRNLSPTEQFSIVKALRTRDFLFDNVSEITAWAKAVAAAGPPEDTDETVIWSDDERVRSPIKNWDQWRNPYKQPKQREKFCSSDWPMYFISFPLWVSSYKK